MTHIKPEASPTEKIIEQVKKCPSGALSYIMNSEIDENQPVEGIEIKIDKKGTKIEIIENGPYLLSGSFEIFETDGKAKITETTCLLCRCGGSKNKPFCDGSHATNNFNSAK